MLERAKEIFSKKSDRKIIGYWIDGDIVIFNTVATNGDNMPVPGQYVVTSKGEVYGTNPLRNPIIVNSPMKKL